MLQQPRALAFPAALLFFTGLVLVYFGLHTLDAKHGLLGHRIADEAK